MKKHRLEKQTCQTGTKQLATALPKKISQQQIKQTKFPIFLKKNIERSCTKQQYYYKTN